MNVSLKRWVNSTEVKLWIQISPAVGKTQSCISPSEAEGRTRSEHWPALQIPASGKKDGWQLTAREDTTSSFPGQFSTLQNLKGRTQLATCTWLFSPLAPLKLLCPPSNLSLQTPWKPYGPTDHLPQLHALTDPSLGFTAPASPF